MLQNTTIMLTRSEDSEVSSTTPVGPRHKKLVYAFQKAMSMVVQDCSLEKVRSSFPAVLGESFDPVPIDSTEGSNVSDDSIIALAYSKMVKTFVDRMQDNWDTITHEMQVCPKLDFLDHLLQLTDSDSVNTQDSTDLSALLQSISPYQGYRKTIRDILHEDIEKFDRELDSLNKDNESLIEAINSKQKELSLLYEDFKSVNHQWDHVFESATKLESSLLSNTSQF